MFFFLDFQATFKLKKKNEGKKKNEKKNPQGDRIIIKAIFMLNVLL